MKNWLTASGIWRTGSGTRPSASGVWLTGTVWRVALLTIGLLAASPLTSLAAPQEGATPATAAPGAAPRTPAARSAAQNANDEVIQLTRRPRPVVRIGQDHTVLPGDITQEVVLISGSGRVDGHVRGDVVIVLGSLDLGATAIVDGDVTVVGGSTRVASGAGVRGDMVVIGGELIAPPDFQPGGEHVVIGSAVVGRRVQAFIPWVTSGLLLGRPLVPSLAWNWVVLAIVFFLSLVISLLFEGAVRASGTALAAKPITTFFMGLLVLLLVGPVSVILAVSVVGIAVIPFLLCALVVAWTIGKIAVTRWMGSRVIAEESAESRASAVRSFVVGFVILVLVYMIPVLGLATWLLVGVLGLGAATSSVFKALRRENPAPPPRVRPAAPVPPATPVPPQPVLPVPPAAPEAFTEHTATPLATEMPGPAVTVVSSGLADTAWLGLPRATFWRRVAAGFLDFLLVMMLFQMLDIDRREPLLFSVLLVAYLASLWTWRGTTIGGIIAQVRVVRADGQPLSGPDSLIRAVSSLFSAFVLGLGFLWILRDPDRQAWHDKIAGTLVVTVPKSIPLR